jgi:hypothetical protein
MKKPTILSNVWGFLVSGVEFSSYTAFGKKKKVPQ